MGQINLRARLERLERKLGPQTCICSQPRTIRLVTEEQLLSEVEKASSDATEDNLFGLGEPPAVRAVCPIHGEQVSIIVLAELKPAGVA